MSILGAMSRGSYCLIGAGAAGLGALQVLRDEGFAVDCFESSDRVGGHRHTDYECLHLITPRDSSGFDGVPMPGDYPLLPSRDQMRDYILGFAASTAWARTSASTRRLRLRDRSTGAASPAGRSRPRTASAAPTTA
jgi:cation diffusion facilitator CzcD-associated flavoprotein CzcO